MHTLACYFSSVKLYLKGILVYKSSLILFFFGLAALYFTSFSGVLIILGKFKSISYWDFGQIIFIYTLSLISYGFRNLIFFPFRMLGDLVKSGDLDRYLIRPNNIIMSILGIRMEIGGLVHILLGLFILVAYNNQIDILWSFNNIMWLIFVIISGSVVQGAITIIIGTMAFYLGDIRGLDQVYNSLREFIWYPINLYSSFIQGILTFILPLAFVSFLPAGIFLENEFYNTYPKQVWKFSLFFNWLIFVISIGFFYLGLKKYTSTGS